MGGFPHHNSVSVVEILGRPAQGHTNDECQLWTNLERGGKHAIQYIAAQPTRINSIKWYLLLECANPDK